MIQVPKSDKWRVGRSVGRTIYDANDALIGVMDTPELAQEVVDARNGVTPKPVGNVLDRNEVRELAFRAIARAAKDPAIKRGLDPLGAFTFFDVLDAITDAVVGAIEAGGVPSEDTESEGDGGSVG